MHALNVHIIKLMKFDFSKLREYSAHSEQIQIFTVNTGNSENIVDGKQKKTNIDSENDVSLVKMREILINDIHLASA